MGKGGNIGGSSLFYPGRDRWGSDLDNRHREAEQPQLTQRKQRALEISERRREEIEKDELAEKQAELEKQRIKALNDSGKLMTRAERQARREKLKKQAEQRLLKKVFQAKKKAKTTPKRRFGADGVVVVHRAVKRFSTEE